jgi:hypothetical protein
MTDKEIRAQVKLVHALGGEEAIRQWAEDLLAEQAEYQRKMDAIFGRKQRKP